MEDINCHVLNEYTVPPFNSIVDHLDIYAIIVTDQVFSDYKEYANLNFIEAVYWASLSIL